MSESRNRKGRDNLEELRLLDSDCKIPMLIMYKEIKHKLQAICREKKVIKRNTID